MCHELKDSGEKASVRVMQLPVNPHFIPTTYLYLQQHFATIVVGPGSCCRQ